MNKATVFSFIFLLLFAAGCKKQCKQQEVIYTIGSEMYNYVFVDTSIFVYLNTTTNAVDTLIMFNEQQGEVAQDTSDNCISLQKQVYTMSFFNKQTSSSSIYFFDYNGITLNGTGTFPNYGTVIYDRHVVNVGDSTYNIKYVAFYNSLTIQGSNIYYIKKYFLNNKTPEYPNETYLYWAPQCGIVRTEVHDSLNNVTTTDLVLNKSHLIYL